MLQHRVQATGTGNWQRRYVICHTCANDANRSTTTVALSTFPRLPVVVLPVVPGTSFNSTTLEPLQRKIVVRNMLMRCVELIAYIHSILALGMIFFIFLENSVRLAQILLFLM